jgi:hypothetical protein
LEPIIFALALQACVIRHHLKLFVFGFLALDQEGYAIRLRLGLEVFSILFNLSLS